jgi:radical SAM superfamily enzyme YgiQ (UPF0313 family)
LAVNKTCKQIYPDIPIIFGGPLTLIPGMDWFFFNKLQATAIIKGDGEIPLVELLIKLKQGKAIEGILGVQIKIEEKKEPYFLSNIDLLPYPSWDELNWQQYSPSIRRKISSGYVMPIIGSRGCPFKCNFCVSGNFIDYRQRSFEKIADEIKTLHNFYGIKSLIFYDDTLFPEKTTINEDITNLAKLIGKVSPDILWQIEIRPDVISNISSKTLTFVYSKGCRQFNIGIEKSTYSQLKKINKLYSIPKLIDACRMINDVCPGMRLAGTFILGGPGETINSIKKTVDFSTKLNLLFAHYCPLELYPGTPIYEQLYGNNFDIWYEKIMNDKYSWGEIIYENKNVPANRLLKEVYQAYQTFYERKEWIKMAKIHFGSSFPKIIKIIKSWKKDRFRIYQSKE